MEKFSRNTREATSRFQIGSRWVGEDEPLFVVAEAGVNHENDFEIALKMVEKAAEAGADAIKFQSYKAEKLASIHSPAYWDLNKEPAKSQFELFAKYDNFEVETYRSLAQHAAKNHIIFLTTAFDESFVDALDDVLVAYKVASADITHFPLLKKIASKGKPVLLSVGAATLGEIDEAVRFLRRYGCEDIALMHCVLNYPCPTRQANLRAVRSLHQAFPTMVIGYSDHVPPQPGLLQLHAAWFMGARIVEKHFTLDKSLPGNDHYHAMDPDDLRNFKTQHATLQTLLGDGAIGNINDTAARQFARRSLIASRHISAGEPITEDMIVIKRPGTGIPPLEKEILMGVRPLADIEADTILQWNMFLRF